MIGFIIGVFVGGILGVIIMALMAAAKGGGMSAIVEGVDKPVDNDVCYGNGIVDIKTPVMALDIFTKTWCIDTTVKDDLSFRCKDCEFSNGEKCLIKSFKCNKLPQYKDFGSMGV